MNQDLAVRLAAFEWLSKQKNVLGDVLPRSLLQEGFLFEGARIPLVSPQGIFKPRVLDFPLSITTTPESPYDDAFEPGGLLAYRYRGTDPGHPDNVGLRRLISLQRPLVYFHGIVPGRYLAVWPVYIVGDEPSSLTFSVAVDDVIEAQMESQPAKFAESSARRAYATAAVRVRLHQRTFRERVLDAYRTQCSLCRLRHRELLDAAHIIPDASPAGEPRVTNGIALCKLHHAAFETFIIGISPDYRVHVRRDVLHEEDGPILQYGLQALQGATLLLPSSRTKWPDRDALDWKFQQFVQAT